MGGGDPAGGSAELARLIDRCGESLLADFLVYYRIDLRDVLVPGSGLSARRALALVRQLPVESATVAELRGGPEFRDWGPDRYLMARLIEGVEGLFHAFVSANSKKKPKAPERVSRPEKRAQQRESGNTFRAMAARRIAAVRNRKKGADGEGSRD
ncbi:hypothetical protein [Amycolatopsis lexingtonensis]|uniref:hypothetical protein n=1 Tax=Amycolatopsis lexingtonensis TaxID=218822 RepID=UPI003F6EFF36